MDKGSIIAAQTVSHHIYGGNKREPWKESKISLNRTDKIFFYFQLKSMQEVGVKTRVASLFPFLLPIKVDIGKVNNRPLNPLQYYAIL